MAWYLSGERADDEEMEAAVKELVSAVVDQVRCVVFALIIHQVYLLLLTLLPMMQDVGAQKLLSIMKQRILKDNTPTSEVLFPRPSCFQWTTVPCIEHSGLH